MESRYKDDQGHRKVTWEQNVHRNDCEKNHAGEEKLKIVINFFPSKLCCYYSIKGNKKKYQTPSLFTLESRNEVNDVISQPSKGGAGLLATMDT